MLRKINITKNDFLKLTTESVQFNLMKDKKYTQKMMAILGCVPDDFTKVYGGHSFTYPSSERRLYNWAFEVDGIRYFLVTAKVRGTTIEATVSDNTSLKKFVDGIINDMKDNPTIQKWLKPQNAFS